MKDLNTLARVQEAERLIHDAIADVPLACSGPEAAAAVQGLGLKMAEACMEPRLIAQNLLTQAEGYLQACAAAAPLPADPDDWTETAHAILSTAADGLKAAGIPASAAAALMLGYASAWASKGANPTTAAENLYRQADAIIGRTRSHH